MSCRPFICLVALGLSVALGQAAAKRPNVLFIANYEKGLAGTAAGKRLAMKKAVMKASKKKVVKKKR